MSAADTLNGWHGYVISMRPGTIINPRTDEAGNFVFGISREGVETLGVICKQILTDRPEAFAGTLVDGR